MNKITYIYMANSNKMLALQCQGVLQKLQTEFSQPINYYLTLWNELIQVNPLRHKIITLEFAGYACLNCGSDETTFRQGFCKSCFFEQPQTADWIMRPELSKAHLGVEERDLDFEKKDNYKHTVYTWQILVI